MRSFEPLMGDVATRVRKPDGSDPIGLTRSQAWQLDRADRAYRVCGETDRISTVCYPRAVERGGGSARRPRWGSHWRLLVDLSVSGATSTGPPSARIDRSPTITCSEPLTGAQGSSPFGRRRELAIGDLDPFAVADAGLDLGPHRLAVLVPPAVSLLTAMGERGHRQRPRRRAAR